MSVEVKEWVRVATSARGETSVTVSLVEGNLAAKYAVKSFGVSIKADAKTARLHARRNLESLRQALAELDAEED